MRYVALLNLLNPYQVLKQFVKIIFQWLDYSGKVHVISYFFKFFFKKCYDLLNVTIMQ